MNKLTACLLGSALFACLPVQAQVLQFTADLNGYNEVNSSGTPGFGDPDGTGTASLFIDDIANTIDWKITVNGITLPPTGAHIHQGNAFTNGPIVVDFSGQLSGLDLADTSLADVVTNPQGFYVNVHNADYPGGAIRGQIALIPEPAAVGMLLAGLVAIGWRVGKRKGS